jgi:hypothetical protein
MINLIAKSYLTRSKIGNIANYATIANTVPYVIEGEFISYEVYEPAPKELIKILDKGDSIHDNTIVVCFNKNKNVFYKKV